MSRFFTRPPTSSRSTHRLLVISLCTWLHTIQYFTSLISPFFSFETDKNGLSQINAARASTCTNCYTSKINVNVYRPKLVCHLRAPAHCWWGCFRFDKTIAWTNQKRMQWKKSLENLPMVFILSPPLIYFAMQYLFCTKSLFSFFLCFAQF